MPANKDPDRAGKWIAQFYYTDWTGERKKKRKRGFDTKREALEWERDFLKKQDADMSMKLSDFVDIYLDDMKPRLKASTLENKRLLFNSLIVSYFGNMPLNVISAPDIRKWQVELMTSEKHYADTYLKTINNQLTALFNYAVKYYGLKENPCHKAGSMGKKKADEMNFWTAEEYHTVRKFIDSPCNFMAIQVLYYTGIREGELLALTPSDIDIQSCKMTVNKTYSRQNGENVITTPKTPKSNRIIALPVFLCNELEQYMNAMKDLQPDQQLFPTSKHSLARAIRKASEKAGIKRIRVHDLRHSHASLLIEHGFSPLLIAERLGHENIETTLNTYAHLWPNKQERVAECLQDIEAASGSNSVLKKSQN